MNVLQSLPQHNNSKLFIFHHFSLTDHSPSPEEYSILQAHQHKNHWGHAPNLETLATAAASQCSSTPKQQWLWQAQEPDVDCNNLDESTASADEHPVARKCTPHNSRIDDDNLPKPTQISFYSGAWVNVLKDMKNEYHFHIHCITDDPFPEHDAVTLQDAHNCLLEAMGCHEDNPTAEPLNQGMFHLHFLTTA